MRVFEKAWHWITRSRYESGYEHGKAKGMQTGKAIGRTNERDYIISYLEHQLTEFAEPLNNEGVTLGFKSALQLVRELR